MNRLKILQSPVQPLWFGFRIKTWWRIPPTVKWCAFLGCHRSCPCRIDLHRLRMPPPNPQEERIIIEKMNDAFNPEDPGKVGTLWCAVELETRCMPNHYGVMPWKFWGSSPTSHATGGASTMSQQLSQVPDSCSLVEAMAGLLQFDMFLYWAVCYYEIISRDMNVLQGSLSIAIKFPSCSLSQVGIYLHRNQLSRAGLLYKWRVCTLHMSLKVALFMHSY